MSSLILQFKDDLINYIPLMLDGIKNTLQLTIVISISGMIGGIFLLYFAINKNRMIKRIAEAYISFFIGTPLLVVLFLVYYGLPQYGFGPSAFTVAMICFTLNVSAYNAAYLCSAYRGLDASEMDAAMAQGFSDFQVYRLIILPQALSTSIPALTNQIIANLKDTSIVFLIGYTDFFARMQELASQNFQFFNVYLFTAISYIFFVLVIFLISRKIERSFSFEKITKLNQKVT